MAAGWTSLVQGIHLPSSSNSCLINYVETNTVIGFSYCHRLCVPLFHQKDYFLFSCAVLCVYPLVPLPRSPVVSDTTFQFYHKLQTSKAQPESQCIHDR